MKISAIAHTESCKPKTNFFIRYSNNFMSTPEGENPVERANLMQKEFAKQDTKMGIETLQNFSIFPKEVIDGKTVITA